MALTGSLNGAWDDGFIDTMSQMRDNVEGQTYSGLDRTNCATDTTVGTIATSGPSSPKVGEMWVDSSTPAAGAGTAPAVRLRLWDGSQWISGDGIYYATTAPTQTDTGQLWYDQTLELLRVYRGATQDGEKAGTGIAGWHPVDEGYQLWKNKSGGAVSANRVVVWDGTNEKGFTTTTNPKDQRVMGVTCEAAAADGDNIVVALVGSGAFVDIYCNATSGNVAIGDAIATSSVAGEGRTVGSLNANPASAAGVLQYGTPLGAFAIARAAISSAGVVPCKLLGYVGAGAVRRFAEDACADTTAVTDNWTSANWDGTWREIDLASMPLGGDAVTDNGDAKHKPIVGVYATVELQGSLTPATAGTASLLAEFGPNGSAVTTKVRAGANIDAAANAGFWDAQGDVFIPTTAGTPYTALGQKLQWRGTKVVLAGLMSGTKMFITGYLF